MVSSLFNAKDVPSVVSNNDSTFGFYQTTEHFRTLPRPVLNDPESAIVFSDCVHAFSSHNRASNSIYRWHGAFQKMICGNFPGHNHNRFRPVFNAVSPEDLKITGFIIDFQHCPMSSKTSSWHLLMLGTIDDRLSKVFSYILKLFHHCSCRFCKQAYLCPSSDV